MKKIILNATIYGVVVSIIFLTVTLVWGKELNYSGQEIFGYASIVVALLFVYFGVRQYRENVNNGSISFGKGMKVGLLITLIPSFLFGAFDIVYTRIINPGFYDKYYKVYTEQMEAGKSAEEVQKIAQQIASEKSFFSNPIIEFGVMFATVFLIGVIVSVISALILRRNNKQGQSAA